MKSDRFLIKAAELYYRDGLSQQEIAKKLHTSRTSRREMKGMFRSGFNILNKVILHWNGN